MLVKEILVELNACKEAIEWVGERDIQTAWNECDCGDWLLWIAAKLDVDKRLVVLAACDCAEQSLKHIPDSEGRPRIAIETARLWAKGGATNEQVRRAFDAANADAYAAYAAAADAYAAYAAAYAASYAADAASYAADAARKESLKRSADLVRQRITAEMVTEKLATRKDANANS